MGMRYHNPAQRSAAWSSSQSQAAKCSWKALSGQSAKSDDKWLYIFVLLHFCVSIFDFKASDLLYLIFNDLLLVIVCILSCLLSFFIQLDPLAVLKMIGMGVIFKLNCRPNA